MTHRLSLVVVALFFVAQHAFPIGAAAQKISPPATVGACPKATEIKQPQMLGLWRAEFDGQAAGATLLLEKNANYTDSFSGEINRNGTRARVAGDVDDGEFTLEESADGVRITATWTGDVVEGSCGREIRGTWQASREKRGSPFVLRKMVGP